VKSVSSRGWKHVCYSSPAALAASLGAATTVAGALGCSSSSPTPAPAPALPAPTRTWKLGFSGTPPRLDVATVLAGIDRWSTRAEIAAIHEELPWTDLLAGMSPDAILDRERCNCPVLPR